MLIITSSVITIFVAILVVIVAWKNRRHKFLLPWLIWNPFWGLTGIGFTFYSSILYWIEQEMATGIGYVAASVSIAGTIVTFVNKFDSYTFLKPNSIRFYFSLLFFYSNWHLLLVGDLELLFRVERSEQEKYNKSSLRIM